MTKDSTSLGEGVSTFKEEGACTLRTRLEKIFLILLIVLLIAAIILTVLFVVYYLKDSTNGDVCSTRDCIISAGLVAAKMDFTVDPCHNFADFACGSYYKEAVIPNDESGVGAFSKVSDANLEVSKAIIQADISESDLDYLKKAKLFYHSCFDEETIEKIGIEPYMNTSFPAEWPTLNPNWDPSTFDINDVIVKYMQHQNTPMWAMSVTTDMKNSSLHAIYISQPKFIMATHYLKNDRNGTIVMALQRYYSNLAQELGADEATASADAEKLIDFLVLLAKIMYSPEEFRNPSALYSPTTLRELATGYPGIDHQRIIKTEFQRVNINLSADQAVIFYGPRYFKMLPEILNQTDVRTIQNFFGFGLAYRVLDKLTKRLRRLKLQFDKESKGTKEHMPRWKTCVLLTASVFWKGISKEFVERKFTEESKIYVNKMIDSLQKSFAEILGEADWIEEPTKKEAWLKFKSMGRKIGYPDKDFSFSDISLYYQNMSISKDRYYQNLLTINLYGRLRDLRKFLKPADPNRWSMAPHDVNAYYDLTNNEIVFPAGILQPPFFSDMFTDSFNYGAIGTTIGHEITHGFDDTGSQFDHRGALRNWWQPKDAQEFQSRTQCVKDHYAAFESPQVKIKVNGIISSGENIADIGGLKEAYRAYKMVQASKPKELPLPGLRMTPDQQFFLAFSQLWCEKNTDQAMKHVMINSRHLPGRFRIIGALQNNPDFATAFNCSVGSYMNPAKKCVVW